MVRITAANASAFYCLSNNLLTGKSKTALRFLLGGGCGEEKHKAKRQKTI